MFVAYTDNIGYMSIRIHELPNMVFGKFQDIAKLLCNYWFLTVVALIEVSLLALQIQYIVALCEYNAWLYYPKGQMKSITCTIVIINKGLGSRVL